MLPNPFATITLTEKQKIDKTLLIISEKYRILAMTVKDTYSSWLTQINNNPYGLTKEQVSAALGEEGALMISQDASIIKALVNHKAPGSIVDTLPEAKISFSS